LSKNLAFEDPSSEKLHDVTDINLAIYLWIITEISKKNKVTEKLDYV
jgi:hypothetical protein